MKDENSRKSSLRANELELLSSIDSKSSLKKVKEDVYQMNQHTIIISDFDKKTPFLNSDEPKSESTATNTQPSEGKTKTQLDKEFNEVKSKLAKLEKKKMTLKSTSTTISSKKKQNEKKLKKKMRKPRRKQKNNKIRK